MSTSQNTIDFLLDQVQPQTGLTARKMFGEYAVYCQGKVVGLVCDEALFLKPTVTGRAFLEKTGHEIIEKPAYPGAKPYFLIGGDLWENADWLCQLILTTTEELPLPKKKK